MSISTKNFSQSIVKLKKNDLQLLGGIKRSPFKVDHK